jgi:hypothetical protein
LIGLAFGLAACSWVDSPSLVRTDVDPPNEIVFYQGIATVAAQLKFSGIPEVTLLRRAPPISPADWIACLRHSAEPPYAMFFSSRSMVDYRVAVLIDECDKQSYAPLRR